MAAGQEPSTPLASGLISSTPSASATTASLTPAPRPGTTPAGRALRRWLLAMAAAALPSMLLIFLFEGSRGWPGILFDQPGRGLYGLSALVYTGPDWLLHASVFAAITLVFVLLFAAAAAFDRDDLAADSLRWASRPRGIRMLMLVSLASLTGGFLLPPAASEVLSAVIGISAVLLLVVAPFLSGNPDTLAQSTFSRWWRPWWPGGRVLLPIFLLWLLAVPVAEWTLCRTDVAGIDGGIPAGILGCLSADIIEVVVMLAIAALWFGYRDWRSFACAMRVLLHWRVLRAVIAYALYVACTMLAFALPVFVIVAYQVYALPQFSLLSQGSGAVLNRWQGVLLSLQLPAGYDGFLIFLLVLGVVLPMYFARDRLLFVHGLGARLRSTHPPGRPTGEGRSMT